MTLSGGFASKHAFKVSKEHNMKNTVWVYEYKKKSEYTPKYDSDATQWIGVLDIHFFSLFIID